MNLENFPTNQTAQKMMETITKGWYDNSFIGKWIFQVMGIEMEEVRVLYEELRQQIFPETATWGLIYHEQKYGITSRISEEIEDRRKRILSYRDIQLSLNPEKFSKILSDMTGGNVKIIEHEKMYTFSVVFSGQDFDNLVEVYHQIRRMKPSHLSFLPRFHVEFYHKNTVQLVCNKHCLRMNWWNGIGFLLDGEWTLNGTWALGGLRVHSARSRNRMEVSTDLNNDISVTVKRNYWCLNGDYAMDGAKQLNAEIRQEVL